MTISTQSRFDLFNAFLGELWEKGISPYLICDFDSDKRPTAYTGTQMFDLKQFTIARDGKTELVLNVGADAIGKFNNLTDEVTGNKTIEVQMRFNGKVVTVNIPYESIKMIRGKGTDFAIMCPNDQPANLFGVNADIFPDTFKVIKNIQDNTKSIAIIDEDNIIKFLPTLNEVAVKLNIQFFIQMKVDDEDKYIVTLGEGGASIQTSEVDISFKHGDFTDEVFKYYVPGLVGENFSYDAVTIENIFMIPESNGGSPLFMDKDEKKLIILHPEIVKELRKSDITLVVSPEPEQEQQQVTPTEEVTPQTAEVIELKSEAKSEAKVSDTPAKVFNFADFKKK